MLDHATVYDALYLLAAGSGREETLFGNCQPLAHEAFSRSLIGDEFPTVWFEVPLMGAPRFDLHVAISRASLHPGTEFAPGAGGGYDGLFRWFSEEEAGGAGLAFAYDISEGRIDAPAVHVNVNGAPLSSMDRFFELAAGGNAAERYRAFEARLPRGWRVWYAGFHPGRPNTPVRIDCFVDDRMKAAYASVPSLFEAHLRGLWVHGGELGAARPSGSCDAFSLRARASIRCASRRLGRAHHRRVGGIPFGVAV